MNVQSNRRHAQRGATLIITLVVMVLIMLVSVSAIRTSTVDEKMAGNSRDRDKAFQAVEAAMRKCLAKLPASSYAAALLLTPAASTATPLWEVDANWADDTKTEAITVDATGLAAQPRCMYEGLGAAGSGNFRITGRAVGASAQTVVMLQATYTTD